jgi:hypothetical protein
MLSKVGSAHWSQSDRRDLTALMTDRTAALNAPGFRTVPNQPETIARTQGQHRPWRPPHRSQLKQNSPLWRTCRRGGKRRIRYHEQKKLASTCSVNASSVPIQEDIPLELRPSGHHLLSPGCVSCADHWVSKANDRVSLRLVVSMFPLFLAL